MLKRIVLLLVFLSSVVFSFENFITAKGDKLYDGNKEYRFISFNIPNLHYVEDNFPFTEMNEFRLPDEFEIRDALESIRQLNGQVVRIYTLPVRKADSPKDMPFFVDGPGKFNEEAFQALDLVLKIANELGVRIIIPFVDNWGWFGGIGDYAAWHGKDKAEFWTNPDIINDFKKTIEFTINRTNTLTGELYKNDKSILAWETGNELVGDENFDTWTAQIAEYVKSLDTNHLLIDGFHTPVFRPGTIDQPNIDIVTTHHYPNKVEPLLKNVKANCEKAKGKKPYLVGEFGFLPLKDIATFLDQTVASNACGALIWSLRFKNRDGGFYWHSEPMGGGLYKAYHWPGFKSGDEYEETGMMNLMRQKAFEIRDEKITPLPKPLPPTLLPIQNGLMMSWQGSTGASAYDIQRAENKNGPWTAIGKNISDAHIQYRPLFNDDAAEPGKTYFYRVIAKNSVGESEPSNIEKITPTFLTLVQEMDNDKHIVQNKDTQKVYKNARTAKEDIHRLSGEKGSQLTFEVPGKAASIKLFTFFPKDIVDFTVATSTDNKNWTTAETESQKYFVEAGTYGFQKPVMYTVPKCSTDTKFVKITYNTKAEISRVEINYGK